MFGLNRIEGYLSPSLNRVYLFVLSEYQYFKTQFRFKPPLYVPAKKSDQLRRPSNKIILNHHRVL
jgi:hypothetical protein